MKVLLTGATGFLGSHLLIQLLKLNYETIIIKRTFSNTEKINDALNDKHITVYDIDKDDIENIFYDHEIDLIIHVATEYGRNEISIHKILETNLILPLKLVELGIKYKVKGFINTDSYFNKANLTYSNLLNYSLSKRSLLTWLKQLSQQIKIVNVVLEHIYGPCDSDTKFVENFIQKIAVQRVRNISMTHGHQKRDFIYVNDVVDAYVSLIEFTLIHDFTYETFEVGTGRSIEIREFVNLIRKLSESTTEINFGGIPYRSDEIMDSEADISKLHELGWSAKYSAMQGVSLILDRYGVKRNNE
jgi:CDP-paratose synthetase